MYLSQYLSSVIPSVCHSTTPQKSLYAIHKLHAQPKYQNDMRRASLRPLKICTSLTASSPSLSVPTMSTRPQLARLPRRLVVARRLLHCSRRASTPPPIVERVIEQYLRPGVTNLAVGLPHWAPPLSLLPAPTADDGRYGACHGDPALIDALHDKLGTDNGIDMAGRRVLVTCGANQAFVQAMLALCDEGDEVVLFTPYYFSHIEALRLCGLRPVLISTDAAGLPDLAAVRDAFTRAGSRIKAVVLTSPSNPSGAVCPEAVGRALQRECAGNGAWLVTDEAYEHCLHDGATHRSLAASPQGSDTGGAGSSGASSGGGHADEVLLDGVVSVFTFSKSFGLAGWRVGYVVYPEALHAAMLSIQDTLPTHAALYSQRLAHAALTQLGLGWVHEQVATLQPARRMLWEAAHPLLEASASPPAGGFYLWLPLPAGVDEEAAIALLAQEHQLLLLPGSASGAPGYLRASYGGLPDAAAAEPAARRLERGVAALRELSHGATRTPV